MTLLILGGLLEKMEPFHMDQLQMSMRMATTQLDLNLKEISERFHRNSTLLKD